MADIRVHLSDQVLERARALAEARNCSLEEFLAELVDQATASRLPMLGMFADNPSLIDEIVESAMIDRSSQPLRRSLG